MTAKTNTQRSEELRKRRAELGLRRMELHAHPDDWPAIKKHAERLQRRRVRREKLANPTY